MKQRVTRFSLPTTLHAAYSLLLMLAPGMLLAESILEFHQRQCADGKQDSCQRAALMEEANAQASRIEELGQTFAMQIDRNELESDNKPELYKAYIKVMVDFFTAERENGIQQTISDDMLQLCAGHYHNYWRNRKLWWPTDEQQRPDWSTIYYYIVDHYYGYCVRSLSAGTSNS